MPSNNPNYEVLLGTTAISSVLLALFSKIPFLKKENSYQLGPKSRLYLIARCTAAGFGYSRTFLDKLESNLNKKDL